MTLLSSWFWPDVSNRKNALAALNEAFWATIFLAALTAIFTFIDLARDSNVDDRLWGFACAAFLSGMAFAIRQKSRIAAVAGLALYVVWRGIEWISSGRPGSLALFGLVSLALWQGVRGTFAFHHFAPIAAGTPSIEESFRSFGQPQPTQEESERK